MRELDLVEGDGGFDFIRKGVRTGIITAALMLAGCAPALISVKAPEMPALPAIPATVSAHCEMPRLPKPPIMPEANVVINKDGSISVDAKNAKALDNRITVLITDDRAVRAAYADQEKRCK